VTAPPHQSAGRWRTSASLSEGVANIRSSVLGPILVAVTVLVVGVSLVVDVRTAGEIVAAETAYLDAGGDLLVARGQDGATVDAARCHALSSVAGVRAAAGVTTVPAAAVLVGRPESAQAVVRATPGVLDILGVDAWGPRDVVASQAVAERWQWQAGTRLQFEATGATAMGAPTGVLQVAAVADLALLGDAASTAVLLVQEPTGEVDECWVRVAPQHRDDVRAALPAVLGETRESAIHVADRLPPGALAQDPAATYDARPTRWAPVAAGVVVGLLWGVVTWTRRGRAALYAAVGVPWAGGVLIRWTEGALVVAVGCVWAAALAAGVGVVVLDVPGVVVLPLAVRGAAGGLAAALVVVAAVGLGQPATLAALKDR
jgi:hypothetical protein